MKDNEEATEFGKRLRQAREKQNLTVGKLAQIAGLTEGAIRQMESGQTKNAVLPNGLKIARLLKVSPWWLAGLEESTGQRDSSAESTLSYDELLGALQTRFEPYVAEMVRATIKSAVLAAAQDL
jgi:transcriptional regulator with XRE-family HTH domain